MIGTEIRIGIKARVKNIRVLVKIKTGTVPRIRTGIVRINRQAVTKNAVTETRINIVIRINIKMRRSPALHPRIRIKRESIKARMIKSISRRTETRIKRIERKREIRRKINQSIVLRRTEKRKRIETDTAALKTSTEIKINIIPVQKIKIGGTETERSLTKIGTKLVIIFVFMFG